MKSRSKIITSTVVATLTLAVSGVATATDRHDWKGRGHQRHAHEIEYARVIDVDPIVRRVRVSNPERECWMEERPVASGPTRSEIRGTIIGGLIGAAIGHDIGSRGRGHDPAAVVGGSMIGAAIGNGIGASKADRRGEYRDVAYQSVEQCQVSYHDQWVEQIDGYRVTYVYDGRSYTTRMPYDPGRRIAIDEVRSYYGRR
jgi:uncharacterized protein YcfJ